MEHFKLVFGSGNSDLAKIRPLKNWPPPFPGSHRLLGTSIRTALVVTARGSNFFLGLSLLFNETTPSNLGVFCGLRRSFWAKDLNKNLSP